MPLISSSMATKDAVLTFLMKSLLFWEEYSERHIQKGSLACPIHILEIRAVQPTSKKLDFVTSMMMDSSSMSSSGKGTFSSLAGSVEISLVMVNVAVVLD